MARARHLMPLGPLSTNLLAAARTHFFAPRVLPAVATVVAVLCVLVAGPAQGGPLPPPELVAPLAHAPASQNQRASPLAPPHGPPTGVFGTNLWGGRGTRTSASAFSMPRRSVALSVSMEMFQTKGLFVSGDSSTQTAERMSFSYAPIAGLELAASERSVAFQYRQAAVPRNLMLQGNPAVQVKYGRHVVGPLALGGRVSARVPPSTTGGGLAFAAAAIRAEALVSVQPLMWLEWLANVGYVYDGSRHQALGTTTDVVERFVYAVELVDRLTWSTAFQARIPAGRHVDLRAFAEIAGEAGFHSGATAKTNPIVASLGARIFPRNSRSVEFTAGADLRATGAPATGSPYGGVAPWQAFAQLAVHYGDGANGGEVSLPVPVAVPVDTFVVRGSVHDVVSGRPVAATVITVADSEAAAAAVPKLTSDGNDGLFASYPLARTGKPLQVRVQAPGYAPFVQALVRPTAGDAEVVVALRPDLASQAARISGAIRHAYTGKPVAKARITLRGVQREVVVDQRGMFSLSLPPGTYAATVRASGFVSQERTFQLGIGAAVNWNVDLEPAGR